MWRSAGGRAAAGSGWADLETAPPPSGAVTRALSPPHQQQHEVFAAPPAEPHQQHQCGCSTGHLVALLVAPFPGSTLVWGELACGVAALCCTRNVGRGPGWVPAEARQWLAAQRPPACVRSSPPPPPAPRLLQPSCWRCCCLARCLRRCWCAAGGARVRVLWRVWRPLRPLLRCLLCAPEDCARGQAPHPTLCSPPTPAHTRTRTHARTRNSAVAVPGADGGRGVPAAVPLACAAAGVAATSSCRRVVPAVWQPTWRSSSSSSRRHAAAAGQPPGARAPGSDRARLAGSRCVCGAGCQRRGLAAAARAVCSQHVRKVPG
jgi:hypothetical protein